MGCCLRTKGFNRGFLSRPLKYYFFGPLIRDISHGGFFMTQNCNGGKSPSKKRGLSTTKIATTAMLLAINVAISAFSSRLGSQKITLSYTICFLAGYILGPFSGGIVGGGADLIGCFISGYTPNPVIFVGSCLLGVIPGLIKYLPPRKDYVLKPYLHCILSYMVSFVVCTAFINTMGLYFVAGYGKSYDNFWAYLVYRLGTQSAVFILNFILTMVLIPTLKKITVLIKGRQ